MKRIAIFLAIFICSIMALSSTLPAYSQSSQSVNWNTDSNYGFNWNYVPQTSISTSTIKQLGLDWFYPAPPPPPSYSSVYGVCCTPLIENGVVYILTNAQQLVALNAANGAVLWQKQLPTYTISNNTFDTYVAPKAARPLNSGHYHNQNIFYSTHTLGRPLVWVISDNYTVYAFDASTGDLFFHLTPALPTHGSNGNYGWYDTLTPTGFLDDATGTLYIGTSASEVTDAGRGFVMAYNVNTNPPTLKWETPVMPPQDGSDPNWDIQQVQSMVGAWIFNGTGAVNLKTLPMSVLNATLYDDWGFGSTIDGYKTFNGTESFGGTGISWGGPWALYHNLLIFGTTNRSPYSNATFTPGPDLWSASILAINTTTGKLAWGFQAFPHDINDYDCSWGVILANVTLSGGQQVPAVLKGCKDGYFYALNANTGALLWYFNPPNIKRVNSAALNPLNPAEMKYQTIADIGQTLNGVLVQNPGNTGGIESDPSYDPSTGLVYFVAFNNPVKVTLYPVSPTPGVPLGAGHGLYTSYGSPADHNATVWALNAGTGKVAWSYLLPVPFRGGLTVSNGLLFIPRIDGYLTILNAQTGQHLYDKLIGPPMDTQPAIGTDTNGNPIIVQVLGSAGGLGIFGQGVIQGDVLALSLTNTTQVVNTAQGISPSLFYGVVAAAVILAVVAIVLGTIGRRSPSPKPTA